MGIGAPDTKSSCSHPHMIFSVPFFGTSGVSIPHLDIANRRDRSHSPTLEELRAAPTVAPRTAISVAPTTADAMLSDVIAPAKVSERKGEDVAIVKNVYRHGKLLCGYSLYLPRGQGSRAVRKLYLQEAPRDIKRPDSNGMTAESLERMIDRALKIEDNIGKLGRKVNDVNMEIKSKEKEIKLLKRTAWDCLSLKSIFRALTQGWRLRKEIALLSYEKKALERQIRHQRKSPHYHKPSYVSRLLLCESALLKWESEPQISDPRDLFADEAEMKRAGKLILVRACPFLLA